LNVFVPALLFMAGCAHVQRPQGRPVLEMPTTVITVDAELLRLNDEELFARGTSAYAASDFEKAARYFGRITDAFPQSPHLREATYNAGLAHERQKQWDQAESRFLTLADATHGQGDALDAAFRLAETRYQLGHFDGAIEVLSQVAARADLPLNPRLEAMVQTGVCQVEEGQLDAAETTLRRAVDAYTSAPDRDGLDDYFPAQGQFFLGEVYRLRYEAVPLNADLSADKLSEDLELKAELLLSAQGHYLRSIRMGNGYWATASGSEIGGLYESFYQQMISAPAPKELKPDEAHVYQAELRKKIRVLLTKAITIYESTLETAERIGAGATPFVDKTRERLTRMKALLLANEEEQDSQPVKAEAGPRDPSKPATRSLEPESLPERPMAESPARK
jgi:tetratricopeptide (TPR) repeat protein